MKNKGSNWKRKQVAATRIALREELLCEVQNMTLMSNTFMSVALNDLLTCQHVVRILMQVPDLIVKTVRIQSRIPKLISHDAILDVLAEDSMGKLYNIEIQQAGTLDHARRIRFYGAMIDSEFLEKGKEYYEMPEVHILYLSETDLWKLGRTQYVVKKYFEGTQLAYEDGMHVTFVNAAVNDGSEAAALMQYFKVTDPTDFSQGQLSMRVHFLKCEEEGIRIMCEVTDRIFQKGKLEGKLESEKFVALSMAQKGFSVDLIAEVVGANRNLVEEWLTEKPEPVQQ